ncbi:MAG: MGMT family protein [Bacteroidia bacterium]|nr:MGMT family protein [Bacteroidia bacterium]
MKNKDFYSDVYEIVRLIPPGRVSTYGAIARCLGASRSSRLVGYAMNLSHNLTPAVPAHRVVNRNGLLTGKHHFSYENEMQELLEKEGVIIENEQVKEFANLFWDPITELKI